MVDALEIITCLSVLHIQSMKGRYMNKLAKTILRPEMNISSCIYDRKATVNSTIENHRQWRTTRLDIAEFLET